MISTKGLPPTLERVSGRPFYDELVLAKVLPYINGKGGSGC